MTKPTLSKKAFAQRGETIYQANVHASLNADDDEGKFVAIDIVSGDFEIHANELIASDLLAARHGDAQIWLRRIGREYAHRFGPRFRISSHGWSADFLERLR